MTEITPEFIKDAVSQAKPRTVVLLKRGPNFEARPDLQLPHLQHIFTLRQAGHQVLTLPIMDSGDVVGISLYVTADKAEALRMANEDPGVKGGRLIAEALSCMAIPGDQVPA